jgi:isopenicillin N synthase-like dioxygenase
MTSSIPVIDLEGALSPDGARSLAAAQALREAAMASGFFYVRRHGVPQALIDAQFDITRRFFALSQAEKDTINLRHSPTSQGYEALGTQTLDEASRPDLKESFYCGLPYPDDHPYVQRRYRSYGRNQWPAQLPDMATQCEAYISALRGLAERLMQLMALSLDLPATHFDHQLDSPMITLRLLRYPPHPADADERTFGAGAHTDWGAITILAQDEHGGLEVQGPDGRWAEATPMPGTFVVNLGDMIPRWTNGRYHSNPHRVRNVKSNGAPRHSIPFFYSPDYESRVEPLSVCVPAGEAPRYTPCTVGEHLREMYEKTYGLGAKGAAMA